MGTIEKISRTQEYKENRHYQMAQTAHDYNEERYEKKRDLFKARDQYEIKARLVQETSQIITSPVRTSSTDLIALIKTVAQGKGDSSVKGLRIGTARCRCLSTAIKMWFRAPGILILLSSRTVSHIANLSR